MQKDFSFIYNEHELYATVIVDFSQISDVILVRFSSAIDGVTEIIYCADLNTSEWQTFTSTEALRDCLAVELEKIFPEYQFESASRLFMPDNG